MKDCAVAIEWLKEIRKHFESSDVCFNAARREAIDDAISALEPCNEEYQRGYIDGVENTSKEYNAEMKKLIDEKDRLKKRLNLIHGTAGFKAAQVYDGRLERLEESVNDLKSKVNSMSWDRHIYMHREEAKQLFKDLINEYYGSYVKHMDVHHDLNEKIDNLEGDITRLIESTDLRLKNALQSRCEIRDEIGDLKYRIKKLEEKDV